MSFIHKDFGNSVAMNDIPSELATELMTYGNWAEIDSGTGWTVLRDSNLLMDIEIKRVIDPGAQRCEFEVGRYNDWDTSSHVWKGTAVTMTCSAIIINSAPGNETGSLEVSYDDDHFIVFYDYRGNGATFRRGLVYIGLALPYTSGDVCPTCGATIFDDSGVTPTNTVTVPCTMPLMYDVSDTPTTPKYAVSSIHPIGYNPSSYQPRATIKATKQGQRQLVPLILGSTSTIPTGGENAGFRCYLQNMYCGMQYDDVVHAETLKANDNKVYEYFEQVDVTSYNHITTRILWRIA